MKINVKRAVTLLFVAALLGGLSPALSGVSSPAGAAGPAGFAENKEAQAAPEWKSLGSQKGTTEKADTKAIYFELEERTEVRVIWTLESEGRRPGLRITLASKPADGDDDKKTKYKDAGVLAKTTKPGKGEKTLTLPPNKYRLSIDYQDCWFRVEADGRPPQKK